MKLAENDTYPTDLTRLLGIRYPIIAGPMFLVSDENLVAAVSNAGGLGAMPSLNWRTVEEFREAVRKVKSMTAHPFAVNIIVNQSNSRMRDDLKVCVEERVPVVITSLGNPKTTIEYMHAVGGKVLCDVTDLKFAKKVEGLGADAVIAVSSGAGGHAGPISPLVLVPHLKANLKIPVIAAGGIATGSQILALLIIGAAGVQLGTRFIASNEAKVEDDYKKAILDAEPEDILLTKKISGTPCAVIRTPYVDKVGTELSFFERTLLKNPTTKKYMRMARYWLGSEALRKAVEGTTYKKVWSAGQSVGLIEDVLPAAEIVHRLVNEIRESAQRIKG